MCYTGKMPSTSIFSLEIAPGVPWQQKRSTTSNMQKLNLSTPPNDCDITAVTKVRWAAPRGSFSRNLLRAKLHETTRGKRDAAAVTFRGFELPLQLLGI